MLKILATVALIVIPGSTVVAGAVFIGRKLYIRFVKDSEGEAEELHA